MRICLLHDIFRVNLFGQGGQNNTSQMWERVLAPLLGGIGHELVRPPAFTGDEPAPLVEMARRHRLAPEVASWSWLYSNPAARPLVREMLERHVLAPMGGADLVLGWELSPNMLRALAAFGLPTIEFNLDAVRFGPDLFLRLRSSHAPLAARLDPYVVPDSALRAHAAALAAAIPPPPPHRPAVLFAGQVADDSSLIRDGALAGIAPHVPAIRAALQPGEALLLKPHPHGAPHSDIRLLHAAFPAARIVTDNIYALLAAPWLRRVVTMTSSVATEAELFGTPALRLLTPDQSPALLPELSAYRRIDARFLTAAFWRALLDGAPARHEPPPARIGQLFSRPWGRFTTPPTIQPRPLAPGARLECGAEAGLSTLLGFGWAPPEDDRIWAEGAMATLLLTPAAGGLRLRLHGAPGGSLALGLAIGLRAPTLEGERLALTCFLDPAAPAPVDVPIPPELCGAPVEVVLRFGAAREPWPRPRFALLRAEALPG